MSDIIRDLLAANRAAVTKLLPRARRLAHTVVDTPEARQRQLREMAEAIYIAERAIDAGAIDWQWLDEDDVADFGDCEPMPDGTYWHEVLHLASIDRGEQDTIDIMGGIIIPHKAEARTRRDFTDQMAVENYRAIARALLANALARLSDD